jgi:hypothetical protein
MQVSGPSRATEYASKAVARLLIVVSIVLAAHSPADAAEAIPYGEGLLWRIERQGAAASHLFGTIHASDDEVLALPAPVAQAFAAAETLATELIVDDSALAKLAGALKLPAGKRLESMLTEQDLERLRGVAAHYRLPVTPLLHLKPWALVAFFSVPPAEHIRKAAGHQPLDMKLQLEATAAGKRIHGLESVEEQVAAFDGLAESDQVALLQATLIRAADPERAYADLRGAYLRGDLAELLRMAEEQDAGEDLAAARRINDRLIADRNERMVERMSGLLAEGNAFIAVGALHLPGEAGILRLLASQGYRITRAY